MTNYPQNRNTPRTRNTLWWYPPRQNVPPTEIYRVLLEAAIAAFVIVSALEQTLAKWLAVYVLTGEIYFFGPMTIPLWPIRLLPLIPICVFYNMLYLAPGWSTFKTVTALIVGLLALIFQICDCYVRSMLILFIPDVIIFALVFWFYVDTYKFAHSIRVWDSRD